MEPYTIARVVLMPAGDIHIAHSNRQTYYCTPKTLLLLLSDPLRFLDRGKGVIATSTFLLNKKQDALDEIPGLTLLSVFSDKRIVCEFTELFALLYSPHLLSTEKANENLCIKVSEKQDGSIDEKRALISFYSMYAQTELAEGKSQKQQLNVNSETMNHIISEIINTAVKVPSKQKECAKAIMPPIAVLKSELTIENDENALEEIYPDETTSEKSFQQYVPFEVYGPKHGVKPDTVRAWVNRGKLKSAFKDESGRWMVDINEKPIDLRAGRSMNSGNRKKNIGIKALKRMNYKEVQRWIADRNLVTANIRQFIRSYDEMKYYEKNNYHEVLWETGPAMIIDINPDYYCKSRGKTNRQIISDGGSPLVPNNEVYKYQLHHIGQKEDSPLAIIPECDHNGQLYNVFHQGKMSEEELHDKEFQRQKQRFWEIYIEKYDEYHSFSRIPFLNSKHKRKDIT